MSWNPDLLSTLATISEHEKEVNDMAGKTSKWSLLGGAIDESNDYELTCPTGTTYVIYTDADGNSITDTNVAAKVWTLPEDNVLDFTCYSAADAVMGIFTEFLGKGTTLTATNGEEAELNNSGAWSMSEIDQTWQDKINLARLMVKYDVQNSLSDQGYSVNELGGSLLEDVVTNCETFRIACDYRTLSLIYEDLSLGGMSELYKNKADRYYQLYKQEYASALRRMQLDPGLTGAATVGRANFTGKLSR